ncbi:MAG: hypothetical protein F6K54_40965 [Okeania sp. SIO3B5]|nr:hypothetical protein [Okeania sp. SIO3B5]
MHKDIEEQKYVWKSGVILKKNKARAEIIEYYGKREIKIRISGQQKRDLMTIVTHELDKIHSSYNNRLKYDKLIPCNCKDCKENSQNPHFYKFDDLQRRINNGIFKTQCELYYNEVDVLSLISDVIEREPSSSFLQPKDSTNPITNHYYGSVINMKDNDFIGSQTIAEKIVNDQSRKIENKDGNIVGNIFGDESNIRDKVTTNSPQPKIEEPKKFGFLDFVTWMQNGQILFILTSSIIGILLLIIYPQLYPDGLPEWVKQIQDIIPVPRIEN